jgi:hypothetical protein
MGKGKKVGAKVGKVGGRNYMGRDWLVVALIGGATKAGVHADHKKQGSRMACRRWRGEE